MFKRKNNVNLKSQHLCLSDDIAHPSQSSSALHFLALGCSPTFYGQTDKLVCLSSHISSWRYAVVKRFLEKRRFFKVWSATLHHTQGESSKIILSIPYMDAFSEKWRSYRHTQQSSLSIQTRNTFSNESGSDDS